MTPPTEHLETALTKEHLVNFEQRLSRLEDRIFRLTRDLEEELKDMSKTIKQQQAAIHLLNKQLGIFWAKSYEQAGKPFGNSREGFNRWCYSEEFEHGVTWKTYNNDWRLLDEP